MPEVKDEAGKVIANMPYDAAGKLAAEKMVAENPGYNVTDARDRSGMSHAGGGNTGFNSIGVPMYKEGGKTDEPTSVYGRNRKAAAERRAARQAKRSKRVVEGKTPLTWKDEAVFGKDKHVYKKGEKGDVSYKKKGTKKEQQVHITKDGKTTLKSEKTKGGDYAVYGKESKKAQSYREAFAEARKKGEGTKFTWDGQEHVAKYKKTKSDDAIEKERLDKEFKEGWVSTEEGRKPPIK